MPPAMDVRLPHLQAPHYSPIGNTMSVAKQARPRYLRIHYLNFIRKGPLKNLPTRLFRIFRIAGPLPPAYGGWIHRPRTDKGFSDVDYPGVRTRCRR